MFSKYDVIVVGAGHAGCEAAAAAANLGSSVLLITMNMQTIAQMSCNPAMGGIAKGQIVREIDALGGYSGIITDLSTIQFRMLNLSKGPAMWSPRAQNDRMLFAAKWREWLENTPNVDFYQDMVKEIIIKNNKACGVITGLGHEIMAESVVVTSGTFLNGVIHIGEKQFGGGRVAEKAATGITEQLVSLGFESDRLKTGTPPRVDGRSLDYTKMEEQKGDEHIVGFSYMNIPRVKAEHQRSCFITYTNQTVHDLLKTGFDRSPMYQGRIEGVGPRYCPSIEDKISRFADRDRHQLFVEPEGWDTVEIYVNGFSTSLPEEVQMAALRQVPGFEKCKIFRPGYAIEYDYFMPTQLTHALETKQISHLFFAGQINGTTGYEEAACQGLMAGINAHQKSKNLEPFILKRSEAYIGVLVDDLINKGTDEPYRMFTSRAEFRTLLRQDNADLRLTEKSFKIGLASEERMKAVEIKKEEVAFVKETLKNYSVEPAEINEYLTTIQSAAITEKQKASKIILRPNVSLDSLQEALPILKDSLSGISDDSLLQSEIQIKYERYIEKEQQLVDKMSDLENMVIPANFDYNKLNALSNEALQKMKKIQPSTLGQASRISGVNPSDIQILMVYMGR
ncbi:MAG: tRNA uridine-5-carboxymethylaminomethyl(34) synthesis enzyme MnmG [Sphingobacteriia bacterium 24-36-13]|jgi:tRNA uridine 5-carboxymethylaminomethyl modification enzyme|uniref:tRNA uridine-5-carboxymethylaminomethyl(34) synthesis enzyme MnmG n=1 Tax=Sediminibacterium sp. TaxID=1917865 RepID=UPI000BCA2370|nr:tRNA uridine-5-carboxymethylaminomethyl(34) synthesis enzyme MnmG [Sediminibacterium sp.]OYY08319.1 MAG: tRNA uridine-5-carboxymethylaminomethyl(34) synthesis enzyme MnmG [Sphingobacteriia bacterium 35-36-14]OYZ53171.1 MAG: tRNA uridine-5-carboxymethylaminomethyl(34) synthesis enzyme MnmG [Sphingobacteriia bacterium 24-36-13]OZA65893.1 MAG: tRNA uridine-5-carboxymethylaminomethyl(34) synthesis enzyme MnmG [Sphingobacteriia bacterium 39-36-14]HQS25248.1 tRNA uridine-5-carboxymethylaminomethyl